MATSHSPLRYPGGKQVLARVLAHLIALNDCSGGTYAEPYAGGAGAALSLLFSGHVKRLRLNDADPRIFAFWSSVLRGADEFLRLLADTPVTIDEWRRQKAIYLNPSRHDRLALGFATFYLNRCNRSGIISGAGPIGGYSQKGNWKIDARFNRSELGARIKRIAAYSDRISITKLDARVFLKRLAADPTMADRGFVYLDPPYFEKGSKLYMNHYADDDHSALAEVMRGELPFKWIMSYDNVRAITKIYCKGFRQTSFDLGYSASKSRIGSELLIFNSSFQFPRAWMRKVPNLFITAADQVRRAMPVEV